MPIVDDDGTVDSHALKRFASRSIKVAFAAFLFFSVILTPGLSVAQQVTQFPYASTPYSGTESWYCLQGSSNVRCTATGVAQIASLINSGITQLTNDVLAGPGSGSQAATIAPNAVTNAKSAQMAANTIKGNFTGSTANPADNAMPSCSDTTGKHLNYVSGTGVTCGTSVAIAPLATGSSTGNTLTAPIGYFVCTSTCTVTPPVPAAGYQFCVMNDDDVSTVITLGAIGSSSRYENTARTTYGTAGTGTLTSGGAVGDMICIVARDATHYLSTTYVGTWTAS